MSLFSASVCIAVVSAMAAVAIFRWALGFTFDASPAGTILVLVSVVLFEVALFAAGFAAGAAFTY
jgi:hypothetical protein